MQTKVQSKFLFKLYFLRISSKLNIFNKNRADKSSNNHFNHCNLFIVSNTPFTYK